MLGLKRGTVALEPHNVKWERIAEETIAQLHEILGDTAVDIQHIGSTAVRSICAKPIIDIAVGVRSLDDILSKNDVLQENGFLFRGQDHPEQYLYVCGTDDTRTHHIHVCLHDSVEWNNYIHMRDYLNAHEEDARAYSKLKLSLAERYATDRGSYTAGKGDLIDELLKRANEWARAMMA